MDPVTICFDFDGTLCSNTSGDYENAEPFPWAIERVNALAAAGHRIIIFTARGTATGIDWEATTRAQLQRWGVRHDALHLGKPSAQVYVDDRAVHTDSWRTSDLGAVPGFWGAPPPPMGAEPIPLPAPPNRTAIVEVGRTYGGRTTTEIGLHAERLAECARAIGLPDVPEPAEIVRAADAAVAGRGTLPDGDNLVLAMTVSDPNPPALADAPPATDALVSFRLLSQVVAGLAPRFAADADHPTLAHPHRGRTGIVVDGGVVLDSSSGPPRVEAGVLAELARAEGLAFVSRPLSAADLDAADEVFVAGLPFCILPVSIGDPASGDTGVVARLHSAWSAAVGIDLGAQLIQLLRRDTVAA